MTREEAIERLEWLEMVAEYVDSVTIGSKCTEDWDAYNMAIAALREQDAADTNVGHKSNADHIRSMTDGELAEFLRNSFWGRKQNARLFSLKEWLKQPYEEENHDPT